MGLLNRAKLAVNKKIKKNVPLRIKKTYRAQVAVGDMTEQQYKELTGEDF
jgi:hypothetical protein